MEGTYKSRGLSVESKLRSIYNCNAHDMGGLIHGDQVEIDPIRAFSLMAAPTYLSNDDKIKKDKLDSFFTKLLDDYSNQKMSEIGAEKFDELYNELNQIIGN
jgi:hypothetical protein